MQFKIIHKIPQKKEPILFDSESIIELSNSLEDIFLELKDDGFDVNISINKIIDKFFNHGQDYYFIIKNKFIIFVN